MKCDNFLASSLPKNSDKSEGGKTWRDVWKAILIQSSRLVYYNNVNAKGYLFNNKRYSPKNNADITLILKSDNYFPTAIYFLYKKEEKYIPKIIYDIMGKKQNNKFSRSLVPHYISKMIFYATRKVYGFSCTSLSTFLTSACVEPPY